MTDLSGRDRSRALAETFSPWWRDPLELARFLRWLEKRDETPIDIPNFLEDAESWGDLWQIFLGGSLVP